MDPTLLLPVAVTLDPRGFNQGAAEPTEPVLDPCSLLSERHYEVVPCVVCALCCIFGVAYCCFGAVLALRWQKVLTVISTAVFGAAVLTLCLDYAVENLALGHHVYDRLRLASSSRLCWCGWAVLATWPALALMGILLQWKVTAEGFSHTDVVLNRRQKQLQLLRIRQREAKKRQCQAPQEGSYRHKASAIKRCAGDVLAPSYIQSLRDRQHLGTGTSLSNLSTSAHTAVDLDYDSGSTVPLTTPQSCR